MGDEAMYSAGSINADFQMRMGEPHGDAETSRARCLRRYSGGKAANRAHIARRLGVRSALLGCVGDDDLSHQALGALDRCGVDLEAVSRLRSASTAVAMITVPPDGKKRIVLAGQANDRWDAAAIERGCRALGRASPGSVLALDCEISPEAAAALVRTADGIGLPIVLDPSFPDRIDERLLRSALAVAPNEEEAGAITGIRINDEGGAIEAARALAGLDIPIVCVKRADGGCVVRWDGTLWRIGAPPVRVVDTTGAGDAFTGALAVALMEHAPPHEAARIAVAASTIAVTRFGSQSAYPDRRRIASLLPRVSCTVLA
jgi:ribokinase